MNRELGATILMAAHDAYSVGYCKRILFLADGEYAFPVKRRGKDRLCKLYQPGTLHLL